MRMRQRIRRHKFLGHSPLLSRTPVSFHRKLYGTTSYKGLYLGTKRGLRPKVRAKWKNRRKNKNKRRPRSRRTRFFGNSFYRSGPPRKRRRVVIRRLF
jgi:hypothetical protein